MTILMLVCESPTLRGADGSLTSRVYRVPTLRNPTVDRWPGSCIYPAMRKISFMKVALACFSLGLLSPGAAVAHGDGGPFGTGGAPTGIELIAFEAPGCIYCPVFRRDVAPSYAATPAGKTAPLRFVDLNEPDAGRLKLSGPVTMVPTLVLVRDGVEIGRIAGYVGRESMHRILAAMLPSE